MKKEKSELEQLLNSLIEKGWKPRGLETKRFDGEMYYAEIFEYYSNGTMFFDGVEYSVRQLVSKESGLWQFCVENGMVKKEGEYRAKRRHLHGWGHDEDVYHDISYTKNDYEYYIIESALKDESELEDFLLNSIKID